MVGGRVMDNAYCCPTAAPQTPRRRTSSRVVRRAARFVRVALDAVPSAVADTITVVARLALGRIGTLVT